MQEHVELSRGWRDLRNGFRRKIDALWFAYFEHLGLTVDYLCEPVAAGDKDFQPTMWIHEWNSFAYIAPYIDNVLPPPMVAEAGELSAKLPEFDAVVAVGTPDTPASYLLVFSSKCELPSINRWSIAGLIDREEERAYYWMLINKEGIGYISGSRQSYAICFCHSRQCALCARYEMFQPAEAYGTAFSIDLRRHVPPEVKKKRRIRSFAGVHSIEDDFRRY